MKDLHGKHIVVVMGGPSSEAEVSRRTGAAVLDARHARGYEAEGMEFRPRTFAEEIKASGADVVFNAMHGAFGEDGRVQAALELVGIPYTGSGVLASAVTMDKVAAKNVFIAAGISTPRSVIYKRVLWRENEGAVVSEIKEKFTLPVVVKAASQGSSIGVEIVEKADDIADALKKSFSYDEEVLVEEFIDGMEITVAVIGDGVKSETMPIIEITTESGRYDYESKYTVGASHHIIPARLDEAVAERAREMAKKTFAACGLKGVARVDMMVGGDVPYVIDVNTVPGMTETSLVPDAARSMGVEFPELCERLLLMV